MQEKRNRSDNVAGLILVIFAIVILSVMFFLFWSAWYLLGGWGVLILTFIMAYAIYRGISNFPMASMDTH